MLCPRPTSGGRTACHRTLLAVTSAVSRRRSSRTILLWNAIAARVGTGTRVRAPTPSGIAVVTSRSSSIQRIPGPTVCCLRASRCTAVIPRTRSPLCRALGGIGTSATATRRAAEALRTIGLPIPLRTTHAVATTSLRIAIETPFRRGIVESFRPCGALLPPHRALRTPRLLGAPKPLMTGATCIRSPIRAGTRAEARFRPSTRRPFTAPGVATRRISVDAITMLCRPVISPIAAIATSQWRVLPSSLPLRQFGRGGSRSLVVRSRIRASTHLTSGDRSTAAGRCPWYRCHGAHPESGNPMERRKPPSTAGRLSSR